MRRAILVAASLLLPALGCAAEAHWQISNLEPLATRQTGDVRWAEAVQRESRGCKGSGARGPNAALECEGMRVFVLNQSARAIQCHLTLERPDSDDDGKARFESDRVIAAGDSGELVYTRGAPLPVPVVTSVCRMLDAEVPAAAASSCATEVTPPQELERFYPPGSIRREETGVVTVDLVIEFARDRPREIRVMSSSGYPDVDNAALRISKALTIRTDCVNAVVRRTIHFDKEPNPPPSRYTDMVFAGKGHIRIED